ncbi:hypothetical protein AJ78_00874 [Emergomyces pasteurianus Ep9510]|uniref:Uncharacterized protein n=1 Tax=Emergomyces pasteurianus Ep9510 TaxID=1447872 RepID=A0A1J9QTH1_9EURO|nr:hypothetical protein AJ78_00874 [Emergomyces pasteurianus Ep9510]
MDGKKMMEKSPARSKGQNTHVKQGQPSSANPMKGSANSPNENIAPGNKNTKHGAFLSKEGRDVPGSKINEQDSSPKTEIRKGAMDSRGSQLNDPTTRGSRRKNMSSETGKENIPSSRLEGSAVARRTPSPPKRSAKFSTQSTGEEQRCDKNANAGNNCRSTTPSPAPSSRNGDEPKGKTTEREPVSGSEGLDMSAKAFRRVATDIHVPLSSRQPSPSKPTTKRNIQYDPSSMSAGSSSNNVMADATLAYRELRKRTKKTGKTRSKKKSSTTDQESVKDGSSSESTRSGRTKQAVVSAVVSAAATMRAVAIDTNARSSKGNGASSRAPSPGNGGELKSLILHDVCNVKGTVPKNGQPSRGEFSPGNNAADEQAFTALGSGQGPSFAKPGNKRNMPRPRKSEKLLERQADADDSSPIFVNKPEEMLEGPESEGEINDASIMSPADIPSDEELGIEKIEEIFGRDDVPDSSKLECIKGIMIKQIQIIARKTLLVNHYLKENEVLQERAEEFDSSILTQEDDMSEQQEQIGKLKAAVEEFQRQLQNQELFIKIAEQDKSRLEEELQSSAKSLKSTEKDRKALKETVSKMVKDMAEMKSDIDKLIGEKNGCLAVISKYESERDTLLCQLHQGPTRLETERLESELWEKSTELAVANQNLKDLQREFAALRKRRKRDQGNRTPSALSTELWLSGDGREDDWEPCIDQSGVERNPFAPPPSPVMAPSLFQFVEPTSTGNGGERHETKYKSPKVFLCQTEVETKGLVCLANVNAGTQTETPAGVTISKPKSKVEVLDASTQTQTQVYFELGSSHNATRSNMADIMEVSTRTISGAGADEFDILDGSMQTVHELDVSSEDHSIRLGITAESAKIEADARVQQVKMLEASTPTVNGFCSSTSIQTGNVDAFEASTETHIAAGIPDMKGVLVQTEPPVTALRGSGVGRGFRLALIMLAWAVIILWGHKEDQQLWLEANGLSQVALVGIRDRSLGPFPWLERLRYDLIVWLQVDRVLPG